MKWPKYSWMTRSTPWEGGGAKWWLAAPWVSRPLKNRLLVSDSDEATSPRQKTEEGLEESDHQLARVEAVLFLARQPISARKIAQIAGLDSGVHVRALVRRLNKLYDERRMAYRVTEVAGGYQLRTRPGFEPWISRLAKDPNQVRLSPPALETLTVVAYRQPILRAEIESIRGVQCGEVIRQLLERGLIRIVGRSDELGRPYLYGTSPHFLEVFGLRGLDDLPHPEYRIPSVTLRHTDGEIKNG